MKRSELFEQVIQRFEAEMPVAETELDYNDPYELLVAVILSAQCTDKRVNMITPLFFKKFPDATSLAASTPEEIFELIKTCSYPNNKTRHLWGMARALVNNFNCKVPDNSDELQKLPGVGRKTANVVLSVAFKQPAMAVDTHVFRVAARIGLTNNAKTPHQAELQLIKYIPEELIHKAHHWLILHGRYTCKARKPECESCFLTGYCKYFRKNIIK
ncbi:MAG: endonuclease III [Bacteroidales bacterium]|nr:endonuclease III [Bacteroidales bacterium]